MYAVVGIWTVDETRQDEQLRLLREEVVPLVSRHPGFVSGCWMHDPETGKSHTAVIFCDRESAEKFKSFVERTTRRTALAGLTSDTLSAIEVIASAHLGQAAALTTQPLTSAREPR